MLIVIYLHIGCSTVTNQERDPPESGHDRQEEGMQEEVSPTEEELWIDQSEALQFKAPHEGTTLSPLNPHTQIQTIVEEDIRLGDGDFGIWSRLDDETYTGRHLIIRRLEEGNWVTFQAVPVIADFTTPGESHLYGLPLSLCRLVRPLGPFFVL